MLPGAMMGSRRAKASVFNVWNTIRDFVPTAMEGWKNVKHASIHRSRQEEGNIMPVKVRKCRPFLAFASQRNGAFVRDGCQNVKGVW